MSEPGVQKHFIYLLPELHGELIADNIRPPFGEPHFFRNIACALLMS